MVETCIIQLKELPSRSLQSQVRSFINGQKVSVMDSSGRLYEVGIKQNKLVLISDDIYYAYKTDGDCGLGSVSY